MFDNWSDRSESRLNAEIQQQWKQIAIASWLEITSGWRRVRVLDDGIEEVTPDQVQALAERCEWAQLENLNTGWSRLERTPLRIPACHRTATWVGLVRGCLATA